MINYLYTIIIYYTFDNLSCATYSLKLFESIADRHFKTVVAIVLFLVMKRIRKSPVISSTTSRHRAYKKLRAELESSLSSLSNYSQVESSYCCASQTSSPVFYHQSTPELSTFDTVTPCNVNSGYCVMVLIQSHLLFRYIVE